MATDNLQIPDIAASQNQKEVTANAAHNLLDDAMNSSVAKVISGDTTFSAAETRENRTVVLTGTPGAAFTVNMPDTNKREMNVVNETNSDATIRNSAGSVGAKDVITIASGKKASFQYTGTDFYAVGSGGAGGAVAVQDEGSAVLAAASAFNFVGAGVTATDAGSGVAQISIPPVTPGGTPGPYRFMASYDLSTSPGAISDWAGMANVTEVLFHVRRLVPSVDAVTTGFRMTKNASTKSTGYNKGGVANYSGSSTVFNDGGASNTMVQIGASQGNASGEILDSWIRIAEPNIARVHKAIVDSGGSHSTVGTANWRSVSSYRGTDEAAALDSVTFVVSSGVFTSGFVDVYLLFAEEPGTPYNVPGIYVPSTPGTSQVVLSHVFTRAVDFPINLAGSEFIGQVAATASTDFDIQKNGVSIGTANFAISATSATFSVASAESFSLGDRLQVIAPASADATLADLDLNLAGVTPAVP